MVARDVSTPPFGLETVRTFLHIQVLPLFILVIFVKIVGFENVFRASIVALFVV